MCQKKTVINVVPNYFQPLWPQMMLYCITFPFRACWEIAEILLIFLKPYAIPTDESFDKLQLEGSAGTNLNVALTRSLSLITVVKSHYKTGFAAVQFSVIAGALREFQTQKPMKIPRITPCFTIVPFPGHKLFEFQHHAYVYLYFIFILLSQETHLPKIKFSSAFCRKSGVLVHLPTFEDNPLK